ncbi:unnamed protein product, partial [Staurois parvus]
ACTHLCHQSPGKTGLEISSLPDLFEIPSSRSQHGPYKQRRKVKSHFPPYQTLWSPSTCLVENHG